MVRILFILAALFLSAGTASAAETKPMDKAAIEAIIKDYIMNNPDVVIKSVEAYGKRSEEESNQRGLEAIKQNSDWLYKNPMHAEAGNPKGSVTIVEIFDYNCGYCKTALKDMMTLLEEDKDLRVIFIELPVLGPSSLEAAIWALAANKQKMYLPFHISLMRHKGPLNDEVILDYAKKSGLNIDKLKKDREDPKIKEILTENQDKAFQFGISGTPAFIIGETVIRGYPGSDALKNAVTEARSKIKK